MFAFFQYFGRQIFESFCLASLGSCTSIHAIHARWGYESIRPPCGKRIGNGPEIECPFFSMQQKSRASSESFCLASLGLAIYFSFNLRSGRIQNKNSKCHFARPCDLFRLQYISGRRSNSIKCQKMCANIDVFEKIIHITFCWYKVLKLTLKSPEMENLILRGQWTP